MGCKRFSSDAETTLVHRLSNSKFNMPLSKEGDFALILFDGQHYIGFITDLNEEECEADVTLLTPELPANMLTWPEEVQSFSVPYPHLYFTVSLVELPDNCYQVSPQDVQRINMVARK